jgi:FSR family fosmidomycin resistance protein-like MFS transporter
VDVFGSTGPVLVTFLSVPMGLSAAQIGLAIGTFQLIAALTQPLFGWLTDKLGSRWFGTVSVPWTVIFMMLAIAVAHTGGSFWLFLGVFSLAAVGSGAFHPQGAMHAATATTSRAATATAIFFLFGQSGLATGPVLAGLILDNLGLGGFYGLGLLSVPVIIFMALAMKEARPAADPAIPHPAANVTTADPDEPVQWGSIGLLAVLVGLRSWTFLGTVAFLPKMFQTMGWTATSYGLITGTYWIASAVAGVVVGNLADRWGRRYVIFATLLLGSIPIYFLPLSSNWIAFPLAVAGGALLGGSNSIFVVIAQALLPGRKALASGATMGYMFGVGAVAVWGIGALADVWTLAAVIQAGAGIGLLSALLALLLPATRAAAMQPQAEKAVV